MMTRPGPLGAGRRRPRRNTTARSYSLRTLMLEATQKTTMSRRTSGTEPRNGMITASFAGPMSAPVTPARSPHLLHLEEKTGDGGDPDTRPLAHRRAGVGIPVLPVHEDPPLGVEIGDRG